MTQETISTEMARRFYDGMGSHYDWDEAFESRAKWRTLKSLDLSGGQKVLNIGVGTGKDHSRLQAMISPGGVAVGVDISPVMLSLTRARTGAPVCQADARALPFAGATFDRLFCSYVLDLIPGRDLPGTLSEFRRVLKPGGRVGLVTLGEGGRLPSRILMALWKLLYAISPIALGGCRPLPLSELVADAGFALISREVVVQLGVPSEAVVAGLS